MQRGGRWCVHIGFRAPARASPVVESPEATEEESRLGEEAELVTSGNANSPSSELAAVAPAHQHLLLH